MADIVPTEAISKAVVREGIDKTAPNRTEAVAQRMIELSEQGNWREALKFGSEPQVTREDIFARIDQIGVKRDRKSGKKERSTSNDQTGSSEQIRFDRAKDAAELALRLKENGYQGLNDNDKQAVRDRIQTAIKQNPYLAKEFAALTTDAQKKEFLERIAGDNVYLSEVRAALGRISKKPDIDDSASDRELEEKRKATDQEVRKTELEDAQRRLKYVKDTLDSFNERNTDHRKYDELVAARTTLSDKESGLSGAEEEERLADAALKGKQEGRTAELRGNVQVVGGVDTTAEREALARASSKVARLRAERDAAKDTIVRLEKEQQSLEQQRVDLSKEDADKRIVKGEADVDLLKAQRDLQDALSLRQRQEQDIATSLEGVFSEAAIQLMDKQIDALGEKYDQALKEVEEKAASGHEKALYDALRKQLTKEKPRRFGGGTQPRRVIDKAHVNDYFNTLMKDGDEAYFIKIMSNAINPETGAAYTDVQIKDLIANKEFMEKNSPEAIKRLAAAKEIVGGIDPVDIYTIMQSNWGKDIITSAAKSNAEFRSQAESLLGQGVVDQPDFMEKLRREAQDHPNIVATLIAGLVGATGGAIGLGGAAAVAAMASAGATRVGIGLGGQNRMFG